MVAISDVVRMLLLEFGADVTSRDSENDTPLNDAALGGHTDVVCALITEFGCSPQVRGFEGTTLLHYASQGGHLELVDKLVSEFKLDPMAVSDTGDTPPPHCCTRLWSEGGSKRAHH